MQTFDVLGLGCLAWDEVFYVREYPAENHKAPLFGRTQRAGGTGGTAIRAAARYGVQAAWAGTVGVDETSSFVLHALGADGVDLSFARRDATASVIKTAVIVNTRRQTRTVLYDLAGAPPCAEDHPPAELIAAAKVLLIDQFGVEGMLRAVKLAREAKRSIVADFEADDHLGFEELLPLVDHLIVAEDFACRFTGAADPSAAVSRLWTDDRRAVIVTCGEKGCWYRTAEMASWAVFHMPAPSLDAIDTTGCGDVFHGVYAGALAEGHSLEGCLQRATAAAALKAAAEPGVDDLPRRDAIEQALR